MIRGSLRQRLFVVVLIAVIPVFVLHVAIQVFSDIRTASSRATTNTQDIAAAALPLLQSALIVGDLATAQETLDNIMRHGQFLSLRLHDRDGSQILAEGRLAIATAEQSPDWFVDWLDFHFPPQEFPISAGGTNYGVLKAEPSAMYLVADIWWRMWTATLLWLVTLAFSLLLLQMTLRRGLQPLEKLAEAAHCFGEGDLNCRAPVSNVPELAETAVAFNRMAEHLLEARGKLEQRIQQATNELDSLITRIPVGVYKLRMFADGGNRFDYVSPRWCELLEIEAEEVYRDPRSAMTRLHPDEVDEFIQQYESARTSLTPFQWEGRTRDGLRARWLHIESTPTLLDNGDSLWEGIQYDISATKDREAELDQIAHYDPLTGLPNRSLLSDRLQQAMAQSLRRGASLAIAFLDLDGFKTINDKHGHDAGDRLLVVVAERMRHALREGDTLARLGGDEFVAILIDLPDIETCLPTLTRLLESAAEEVLDQERSLRVSASLGVTFYPQMAEIEADQLLRQADQAMYQAKLAGKNRYHVFDNSQHRAIRCHHESLERIQQALNEQEFSLCYQPKVNLRTGQVVGLEALLRWQHSARGPLLPGSFLPVAEDHLLALAIGDWVLDTALNQIAIWHEAGLNLPVSINVGARQLQQADFMPNLRAALARHPDAPPSQLELEVMETSALADIGHVAKVIEACNSLGIQFALDDFGTGDSSLTYLKRLPAHTLKIDQIIVRDMLEDPEDLAILEGIIGLSVAFRRLAIAEGVETLAQGAMLLDLGCELAQGFAIARPMPAADIAAWVETWRPDPGWLNRPAWSRDDLPILFAEVEHCAWIAAVEAELKNKAAAPLLDHHACRFGTWLDGEGRARYGTRAMFETVETLHREVHEQAQTLLLMKRQGKTEHALNGLPELHRFRDRLLEQLRQLA
jgi:diguanylate cyclase (GGDEF)-like protein